MSLHVLHMSPASWSRRPLLVEPSTPKPVGFEGLLTRGALHEVFSATPADALAATCFALASLKPQRLLWARQDMAQVELGAPYGPGLSALGFDPSAITLVHLRDAQSVLQAGLEAARTKGLSSAIIELWGAVRPYDLTASRKLVLAAKASGVTLCVLNHAAQPAPSAAETRWQVKRLPSRRLPANAPGQTAFNLYLLRHRNGGAAGQQWSVEWNHERFCFEERKGFSFAPTALFKPVVSIPPVRKLRLYKFA